VKILKKLKDSGKVSLDALAISPADLKMIENDPSLSQKQKEFLQL
jgi:hypothetical protein